MSTMAATLMLTVGLLSGPRPAVRNSSWPTLLRGPQLIQGPIIYGLRSMNNVIPKCPGFLSLSVTP